MTKAKTVTMTLAVAGTMTLAEPLVSLAHDAPSGWHYPDDCCADHHCHPVPCEEIIDASFGLFWRGLHFVGPQIRPSGDAECHVCHRGWIVDRGNERPQDAYCIFIRPTS